MSGRNAEDLARFFHDTYERIAPSFGYETRQETRAFDPATPNGRLMVAVCEEFSRLIEIAVLKGQIEVADEIAGFRVARFTGYELADRLAEKLRVRLSELEGSHE